LGPDERSSFFCAKLQPWKRPLDVVARFAAADILVRRSSLLVMALSVTIEAEAYAGREQRGDVSDYVNQSQLPGVYRAST